MKWLQAAVVAAFLTGCTGNAPVSFSVRGGAGTTAQAGVASQALVVGNGIELTRARILVRDLELKNGEDDDGTEATVQSDEGTSDDGEKHGEGTLRSGPFVVDLQGASLEGDVERVVDVTVPAGTYRKLQFKIHRGTSTSDEASTDAAVQAMVSKNASIVLEGTVDGEPFEFVTGIEAQQEYEGTFELTAEHNNLTLHVDPTGWFTSSTGERLDPRDSGARSELESNLKTSMKVMSDRDEDGRDDDTEDDHGEEHDD